MSEGGRARPSAPRPLAERQAQVLKEFAIDGRRYVDLSMPLPQANRLTRLSGRSLDTAVTRLSHRIEKGLALPAPRRPFGALVAQRIRRALANPAAADDEFFVAEARRALDALDGWNERGEIAVDVAPLGPRCSPLDPETTAAFLTSRHSVRDYDPTRPVDRSVIEEAVRLACSTPSVCNRQGWRAYYFDDPAEMAPLLALHRGSRGFGATLGGLFVITYDLGAFEGAGERNQGWIDAGMFAMTLLLALHGLGLGAIPLNWSRRNRASARLRKRAGIPEHDNIVMLVGVGHPSEGFRVARSTRRPLTQILRIGLPAVAG